MAHSLPVNTNSLAGEARVFVKKHIVAGPFVNVDKNIQ